MKVNRIVNNNKAASQHEPWFDPECSSARQATIKALRDFRKCRNVHYLNTFKEMQNKLNMLYAHTQKKDLSRL